MTKHILANDGLSQSDNRENAKKYILNVISTILADKVDQDNL